LPEQLAALAKQDYRGDWEVVVVDDGSTDDTAAVVSRAASPRTRLIRLERTVGICAARNVGVAHAHGEFLAFCDADDAVDRGWLRALVDAANTYDLVGGYLDVERLNATTVQRWRRPLTTTELPVALGYLPYAVSANFGIWTATLRDLGGWNDAWRRGGTDVELCWRAQRAGYRLGYAPDAVVAYRYRPTLTALCRQSFFYGQANARLRAEFAPVTSPSRNRGAPRRRLFDDGLRGPLVRAVGSTVGYALGRVRFRAASH
jgi:glycosyltransferase involved in cell wall biosynthesis